MKYEILNNGRIKALKNFNNVKKGDIGGYIEFEYNLSQDGNCWIYDNARIYGNARIYDNARIYGNAKVYGNAQVYGYAKVHSNAKVYDNAIIYDNAEIHNNAEVYGRAEIYSKAILQDNTFSTKKVFNSDYDTYNITITDNHITIGCKTYTIDEWFSFDDKFISSMDRKALSWWKKWKPILMDILEVDR